MNDSDGTPCRRTMIQKSALTEPDDPGSRRFNIATRGVNARRSIQA